RQSRPVSRHRGDYKFRTPAASVFLAVPQRVAAMRAALPLAHAAMREPGPGHGIRPGPGAAPTGGARRRALIATRVLAVVATSSLAKAVGRPAAPART